MAYNVWTPCQLAHAGDVSEGGANSRSQEAMNRSRQQSAHRTNSAHNLSSSSDGAGGQHATGAGQLQRGKSPSSNSGQPKRPSKSPSSNSGQPKRPSKFSASGLASSLFTALTEPNSKAALTTSDSASGGGVPSSGWGTFSQAAASASGSRSTSGALKPSSTSISPANSGAGSLGRQPSEATTSSAGANAVRGRLSSRGASQPVSPLPSSRGPVESPGSITPPKSAGPIARGTAKQLASVARLSGSYSLEGGKCVLFKEAVVTVLDPLGQPVGGDNCSSSHGSLIQAGRHPATTDGSAAEEPVNGPAQAARGPGTSPDPARLKAKVSFHLVPHITLLDDQDDAEELAVNSSSCGQPGQQGPDSPQQPQGPSTSGHNASSSPKGLKGGLAAIADKFKKLALVLDRGSDGSRRGSSVGNSTGSSTDGAGISISPVPTPKDGSSVGRAVAHKQHHGYLPTPTASMAGQFQRHLSLRAAATETEIQLPPAGNSNVPGSLLAPSTVAAAAAPAAPTAAVSAAASPPAALGLHQDGQCAGAAGLKAGEGDTADMPPLAPGAVPTFGGCGAPAVTRPGHAASASSVQDTPSAAVQGNSTARSGGVSEPLRLGPSSLPGPLLLAMSPHLPPALQRDHWCLVDFVVLKKLYDGYASLICKARDRKSGTIVALKLYRMHKLNGISSHQVAREVRLHIGLQHENIITLHAAWQEAGNVVLVQEFAGGGDLWSFMEANSGRLTERVTVSLVLQPFLKSLQFLHSAGIVHRDVKPENILFTSDMVLKLADLGLAVNLLEEPAVTRVGTLDYMPPEVLRCPLKRHPGDNKSRTELHYTTAVDSWAAGVLAYELLTGRAPFAAAGASDASIQANICSAAPTFPSRMSEPAKQLITAALSKTPAARPTVLQMLQHPWIRSYQRSSTTRAESRPKSGGGSGMHTEAAAIDARTPEQRNTVRPPACPTASSGSSSDTCEVGGGEAGTTGSSTPHKAVALQDFGLHGSSSMRQHKTAAAGPTNCLVGGNASADAMRSCDDIGLKGYATS